jgi:hypothetical protein
MNTVSTKRHITTTDTKILSAKSGYIYRLILDSIELMFNMNGYYAGHGNFSFTPIENLDNPDGVADKLTALITDKNIPLFDFTYFHF